jgi:chorismate mutase
LWPVNYFVFFDFKALLAYEVAPGGGEDLASGRFSRDVAMPDSGEANARKLAELRGKIDLIDAEMHKLLIERGTVIDALIRTKGTSLPGAAFRPGREADMMRRLVARHSGALPVTIAEHIWREIITTFTHIQAPFSLAVDGSAPADRMRDLARFYFGFSVEILPMADAASTVAHVAVSGCDLGLVALAQPRKAGPWWRELRWPDGPRIMAMLPFIGVAGRPADLPAFVVSPALADPTPAEITIVAARVAKGSATELADAWGGRVLATAAERTEGLFAVGDADDLAQRTGGVRADDIAIVGAAARTIAIDEGASAFFAGIRETA